MGIKPQISSGIGHLLNAENPVVEQPVAGSYGVRHRVVETFDLAMPQQGRLAPVRRKQPRQLGQKELQIGVDFLLARGHGVHPLLTSI
jgi:hypothetical protein